VVDQETGTEEPLISVLLYVKNAIGTIAQAVQSVLDQDYDNTEIIVIDGASTDGTAEYLSARVSEFAHFVSEPDSGGAEAANKAIAHARGDLVCFVFADDWLLPGILRHVVNAFGADPETDIVSTGVRLVQERSDGRGKVERDYPVNEIGYGADSLLATPMSAAKFYRRELFERLSGLDRGYPYAHDRDFLMRCFLAGVQGGVVDEIGYVYRQHAGSRTLGGNRDVIRSFLDEHWRMSVVWLESPGISHELRRKIRRWRRVQRAEAVFLAVRDGKFGYAVTLGFGAVCAEPKFPFALGALAVERLTRPMRRRAKGPGTAPVS
jgi:glycosyltransferase involved in cell wall biosynthesis